MLSFFPGCKPLNVLRCGVQVMVASSGGSSAQAMHATSQQCDTNFHWRDYNRFSASQCLSFGIRSPGDIDIALAEMPTRASGSLLLHIGVDTTMIQTYDLEDKEWATVWSSDENLALQTGSAALMSKFWVCLTPSTKDASQSTVTFGVRHIQIVEVDVPAFSPRYFSMKCTSHEGSFVSIEVTPSEVFQKYLTFKNESRWQQHVENKKCIIPNCKSDPSDDCTCAECMEGEMKHCNTVTMGLNGMPSSIQLLLRKRVDLIVQVTLRSRAHKDRPTPASKASGKSSTRVLGWHLNLQTCPGRDILNTKVCT